MTKFNLVTQITSNVNKMVSGEVARTEADQIVTDLILPTASDLAILASQRYPMGINNVTKEADDITPKTAKTELSKECNLTALSDNTKKAIMGIALCNKTFEIIKSGDIKNSKDLLTAIKKASKADTVKEIWEFLSGKKKTAKKAGKDKSDKADKKADKNKRAIDLAKEYPEIANVVEFLQFYVACSEADQLKIRTFAFNTVDSSKPVSPANSVLPVESIPNVCAGLVEAMAPALNIE